MQFFDDVVLDGTRITSDGYMVTNARVARVGVQLYAGREMGKPELSTVRVYRPESEVFAADAIASFAHKPVTIGHPPEMVTADNWSRYAKGQTDGEVMRDGATVRVPMVLMDAGAIKEIQSGKKQLSAGYTTDIVWGKGVTDSGEEYDATMTNIRNNHVACVDRARGGPDLKIVDHKTPEKKEMTTRTILVDGLSVEVTDQSALAIEKLQATIRAKDAQIAQITTDAATAAGAAAATLATAQAELATVKTKIVDGAALDALIIERGKIIADAETLTGAKIDATGKTNAEIRKAAVTARLGDAACAGKDDTFFASAFDVLMIGGAASPRVDALRSAIGSAPPVRLNDEQAAAAAHSRVVEDLNAWRKQA